MNTMSFTWQNQNFRVSPPLWASFPERKPSALPGKTNTFEFRCYCDHPPIKWKLTLSRTKPTLLSLDATMIIASIQNHELYPTRPTLLSSDAIVIILLWMKTICFTGRKQQIWISMLRWLIFGAKLTLLILSPENSPGQSSYIKKQQNHYFLETLEYLIRDRNYLWVQRSAVQNTTV